MEKNVPKKTYALYDANIIERYESRIFKFKMLLLLMVVVCLFITLVEGNLFLKVCNMYDKAKAETNSIKTEYNDLNAKYAEVQQQLNAVTSEMNSAAEVINDLAKDLEISNQKLSDAEQYINDAISAPADKRYTPNTDLGISETITADRMNRIIDYWLNRNGKTDSPFSGRGEAFIKASQESGLDPIFIFAIASHESAFGTSNIAKKKNNFMGIGAFDNSPYKSAHSMGDDIDNAIVANACWVASNYYSKGQNTLHQMIYGGKQYSTSKDKWINGINSIMNRSAKIQ